MRWTPGGDSSNVEDRRGQGGGFLPGGRGMGIGGAVMNVLTVVLLIVGSVPVLADTTYYIVQDKQTKKCTIVKEKPKADTLVGINLLGLEFKTQVEAEQAVKTEKVCVTKP